MHRNVTDLDYRDAPAWWTPRDVIGRLIARPEYTAGQGKATYFYRANTAGLAVIKALLDTIDKLEGSST